MKSLLPDLRRLLPCVVFALLAGCGGDPAERLLATQPVVRGDFAIEIEAQGLVEPLEEVEIRTRASGKIAHLTDEGTQVSPGDVVAELESERLRYRLVDRQSRLRVAKAQLKRQTAYADMRIDSAKYYLALAKASVDVAKAEYQNAKAGILTDEGQKISAVAQVKTTRIAHKDETQKLAVLSELQRMGVQDKAGLDRQKVQKQLADIDVAKAKLQYDDVMNGLSEEEMRECEIQLRLAEHRLRAAQKRLDDAVKHKKSTIAGYERRVRWRKRALQRTQEQLEATVIKAESSGVVMVKSVWGRKLVPGHYIYRSQSIASLPALSHLKVQVWLREQDAAQVRKGQKAQVVVPAYPGKCFDAQVHKVSRLVKDPLQDLTDRDRKRLPPGADRLIRVDVAISQEHAPIHCGMSARVKILVGKHSNAVYIPKSALRSRLRVLFEIDPEEANRITPGLAAEVSSPAQPDVNFKGVVSQVGRWEKDEFAPLASADQTPTAAEIRLDDVDGRLRPGANIAVDVTLGDPSLQHYFPKKRLRLERLHFVMVRHGDRDEQRRVEVGPWDAYWAVVQSGLKAGERVVLGGA